jgi:hypothetical protein
MSTWLKILIPVALSTTVACTQHSLSTSPGTQVSLADAGDSLALEPGKAVSISGGPRLMMNRVASDSRCARDVVCVWAGDASVDITADPPCYPACLAPSLLLSLHTNLEPREGEYFGFTIRLLAVEPVPVSGHTIAQSEYRAWVRVTRVSR